MKIKNTKKYDNYILLETTDGNIRIKLYSDSIIRITYTKKEAFSDKESLMVVQKEGSFHKWTLQESEDELIVKTDALNVCLNKYTCAITYKDHAGKVVAKEPERGGKNIASVDVIKTVFDETTESCRQQSVDGIRSRVKSFQQVVDRSAYHTKLEFEFQQDEALFGLGSHEEGILNLRGHHQFLYQQNMKSVVPMLVSSKGYGILIDSYSLMTFHDDVYGSYIWTDIDDEMDFYFIYGPEFDSIVKSYRFLTGGTPMLPKWSLGYMQSKERYETQDELVAILEEYRNRQIPIDAIVLDWKSWPEGLWGQKSFDLDRFPNPKSMMEKIHQLNAQLMISIWPIMAEGGENHKEMKRNNLLLGNQANYNPFIKKGRDMYWDQANEGLFSHGIDAWWCDCTEPFEADWTGEFKPEPEERVRINTDEAKKYIDPEYINAFSILHSKGIYEGQRATDSNKRVVNLTRSSYGGQHRYSTITWSGDIAANWHTLRNQIAGGLNFCVTGEPYWTVDIGAFFVGGRSKWSKWCDDKSIPAPWFLDGDYDEGCDDLGYRELYLRWLQYGVFLPMFRSHGTDTPREVWRFGEKGTVFYDTMVKFIYLRYRLMPYIYSLVGKTTQEDYTMMRLLAFDFREDIYAINVTNQYMFGDAILVCPVTEPMYYGPDSTIIKASAKTREVYLPEGTNWYDFWTGEQYAGGATIEANADLEIMPLYVRAGAIIPMGPKIQHTKEMGDAPWELRIYQGANAEFEIYEDEGNNYNYENGAFSTYKILWKNDLKTLTFTKRHGEFEGIIRQREFRIILVDVDKGVGVEQSRFIHHSVIYNGEINIIDLAFSD